MTTQNDDLIRDLFGTNPELTFFTALNNQTGGRRGGAPMRRFFQNQFDNIFNNFLGQLGSQLERTGVAPTTTFQEFLQGAPIQRFNPSGGIEGQPLRSFSFADQFFNTSPLLRGAFDSRFAPTTRFLNF